MRIGLAIVWLAAAVSPLGASVIFTDLSIPSFGEAIEGSGLITGPQSAAGAFSPTANSIMTEVQVLVRFSGGSLQDSDFNLYLYPNSGGFPVSSLETLGTDLTAPTLPGIVTESTFAALALTNGTEYWLVMTPFDSNTFAAWIAGGIPAVQSDISLTSNGSSWGAAGPIGLQFEIDGTTSVLEPGTAGLVTVGLGLAALTIKRTRIV